MLNVSIVLDLHHAECLHRVPPPRGCQNAASAVQIPGKKIWSISPFFSLSALNCRTATRAACRTTLLGSVLVFFSCVSMYKSAGNGLDSSAPEVAEKNGFPLKFADCKLKFTKTERATGAAYRKPLFGSALVLSNCVSTHKSTRNGLPSFTPEVSEKKK